MEYEDMALFQEFTKATSLSEEGQMESYDNTWGTL
jgi:hypothetical protein